MFADPLRSLPVLSARPCTVGPPGPPEVSQLCDRDGVYELVLSSRGVEGEVEAVIQGPAEFALVAEESLLLLCHRFGDVIPWSLATYGPQPRAPRDRGQAPAEEFESRAILHIGLLAPDQVTELACRNVTLSLEFSRALRNAIRHQARSSSDPVEQRRALQRLLRRYPTVDALVGHASARTIGSR